MQELKTDIVICGGGFAGLSAALTAREVGAEVILLEKRASLGGTSNSVEGTFGIESPLQQAKHIGITKEEAFKIHMAYGHWQANPALVRVFIEKATDNIRWLLQMGVEFQDVIAIWPGGAQVWHLFKAENERARGAEVIKILAGKVKTLGIQVCAGAEAKELLRDSAGAIAGLVAQGKSGEMRIKTRAVIVATGNFSNNREMMARYTRFGYAESEARAGADGEGIKMAWAAGAAAEGLGTVLGRVALKGAKSNTMLGMATMEPHLKVNIRGERFCAEDIGYEVWNTVANQPGSTVYAIFDETAKNKMEKRGKRFRLAEVVLTPPEPVTLDGDIKQGIQEGYLFTANSLPELGKKIGVDLYIFKKTLDEYNRCCRRRYDDVFFKNPSFLELIAKPKFYAIKAGLAVTSTLGGIKINHKTEVFDRNEKVIPGLYAAGICAGGLYGDTYDIQNTTGGASAFAFGSGRIAGDNAAVYAKKAAVR